MAEKPLKYIEHHNNVAQLGCCICGELAQIHHLKGRKHEVLVIPLCPYHHVGELSIHKSKKMFRDTFGDEKYFIALTRQRLLHASRWPVDIEKEYQDYLANSRSDKKL